MHRIPNGFENFNQFILWRPVPRDNGKVDKIPTHPETGGDISAHDPNQWMSAKIAAAWANHTGLEIGFVFTEQDPFFFIDIDDCLIDGAWTKAAVDLCNMFSGASVEISHSQRALHIFGSTAPIPDNVRKKSNDGTFDLYYTGRFVALTGYSKQGNALVDCSAPIQYLINTYLQVEHGDQDASWTTQPVECYTGPSDDGILIEKLINSRSTGIFESRASIQDLWFSNAENLGKCFPHDQGINAFDHSAADAALCQHLAFWTGKDCARIDRLFRKSMLYREKWEKRQDYREATILRAVRLCNKVYDKPRPGESENGKMKEGLQFLTPDQQIKMFEGCIYIRDLHAAFVPDGALLKPDQFRATYGGYLFQLDALGSKSSKSAWEIFTESQAIKFPKAHNICFRPELPSGAIIEEEGKRLVNIYVPIKTRRVKGDPGPFLDLMNKLLPDPTDQTILLSYMAACVQYIGTKFQWAPLIQGLEGNGKTFITDCVSFAVGYRYTHLADANDLSNKFNSWLIGKVLVGIEEVYTKDRFDFINALKPMITNRRIGLQGKGTNQITGDNRANFIMNTNPKDAIVKTKNNRRFCVFYTAQQDIEDLEKCGMSGDYFPKLYEWARNDGYAIINEFLHTYQIPDQYNPATHCHRAPHTSATDEAEVLSLGSIEQEILEAVEEDRRGFAGGWVSSFAFDKLLEDRGDAKRISRRKRREILKSLDYDWHPGLPKGRVNNPIPSEGGKPVLYIHKNHHFAVAGKYNASEIVQAYLDAQNKNVF